jgi:hypothetical protein
MKTFIISFFDTRLNIDRETTEHATSAQKAEANFQFRDPDYLILNVKPIK